MVRPSLINHVLRDLPLDQPLPAAGANVWLTAVPSEEMHTTLSRHEWLALLRLRYGQVPEDVVSVCVCGESNTLIHPLVCPHGGHQIRRHDRLRDLLAGFVQAISPVSVAHWKRGSPFPSVPRTLSLVRGLIS